MHSIMGHKCLTRSRLAGCSFRIMCCKIIFIQVSVHSTARAGLATQSTPAEDAGAPSVDLHFQHFSNHSLQTCWKVPCWFNCAKGTGLGVMVQLFILAAQLRYSHSEAASAQGAHAKLAAIVRALKSLHKASEVKGRDLDKGMKQWIETVEDLFEGLNKAAAEAAATIQQLGLDALPLCALTQMRDCTTGKQQQMWGQTQGCLSFKSLCSLSWKQIQAFDSNSTVKAFQHSCFLPPPQLKRFAASSLVEQTEQFATAITNNLQSWLQWKRNWTMTKALMVKNSQQRAMDINTWVHWQSLPTCS